MAAVSCLTPGFWATADHWEAFLWCSPARGVEARGALCGQCCAQHLCPGAELRCCAAECLDRLGRRQEMFKGNV